MEQPLVSWRDGDDGGDADVWSSHLSVGGMMMMMVMVTK
jgi:hypothetical protein